MPLKMKIKEDREPTEVTPWREENTPPDMQYWVVTKDGEMMKYMKAEAKDVFSWAKSLHSSIPFEEEDIDVLELSPAKTRILDVALERAVEESNGLFGTKEQWDALPEWQRMSKFKEKKEK